MQTFNFSTKQLSSGQDSFMRCKALRMLTSIDKIEGLIEKGEKFAVSLRKKKKQDTLSTKRCAFNNRQIRCETLINNPEEEEVKG